MRNKKKYLNNIIDALEWNASYAFCFFLFSIIKITVVYL